MKKLFLALLVVCFVDVGVAYAQNSADSNSQNTLNKGEAVSAEAIKNSPQADKMRTGPAFLYEQESLEKGGERGGLGDSGKGPRG